MATITDIKNKILDNMSETDISKLNLMDLSVYVDILRRVADVSEKNYMETLVDMVKGGFGNSQTSGGMGAYCAGYAIGADSPAGGE